jgi:hypothetical protein
MPHASRVEVGSEEQEHCRLSKQQLFTVSRALLVVTTFQSRTNDRALIIPETRYSQDRPIETMYQYAVAKLLQNPHNTFQHCYLQDVPGDAAVL